MKHSKLRPVPKVPYQKMYTTLFNAFTDAVELLEEGKVPMARRVLMEAQQKAEDLYIGETE